MKKSNSTFAHLIPVFALAMASATHCHAQKLVDSRDQAEGWYVPMQVKVTAERGKAKELHVQLYKENAMVQNFTSNDGKFMVNLDLDNSYTIVLEQGGYRPKSICVDTHVPAQQVVYQAIACPVNLEAADKFTHADPFYLDFPGAIIRWDNSVQGFMPQSNYVADIQSKIGMLQAQMSPK